MITNNGYIRGEYAVIGKTAYAGTKLSDYRLHDDEFTKHYLTTKEYVDSKVVGNSIYSIYSPYTHNYSGSGSISAFTSGNDDDGKPINIGEDLSAGAGKRYVLLISGNYNLGIVDSSGSVGVITELDLGQQIYSELDNQIYTLIQYGSPATKILVPETITLNSLTNTDASNITTTDIITFDKLFNDSVYHKITISPLDLSTNKIYTSTLTIPTTTSPSNYTAYIEYLLKNNNEENVGKIISLSSYSGIVNTGINALLFEIDEEQHRYTAQISTIESNVEVIDTITITYSSSGPSYSIYNDGTTINSTSNNTYYLIDYYNKHVVKCDIDNSGASPTASVSIDDSNIGAGTAADVYEKDLSLLADLTISKIPASSPSTGYTSYTITIRALSSPETQHITDWVIETPLILNTYKQ